MRRFVVIFILFPMSLAYSRTLEVAQDGSGDFTEVWQAVQAAEDRDTVFVHPGSYSSTGISITHSITLKGSGADKTFLVTPLIAISIDAEGVIVEGFHIQANAEGRLSGLAIGVGNHSVIIRQNIIAGAHTAISCSAGVRPTIHHNDLRAIIAIRLDATPHSVDARFNWWNTKNRQEIEAQIWDGSDQNGLGFVEFEPWLDTPTEVWTLVRSMNWGNIKTILVNLEGQ